ncbi:MAG: glucosaminidase domain-containing protein, partial [Pyrinomonadaceae bacterium]|nr:glucosaminidase domain-containing protein [Sphingobacteriaceae bacterium]
MKALKAKLKVKNHFYYVVMVFISFGIGNYVSTIDSKEIKKTSVNASESFSEPALLAFMKKLKIKYPETVLSQARLETGNFTSDIFKENHNLFGMKVAEKRPTSAIGVHRGHAQYRDWKDSVVDYALFQSY